MPFSANVASSSKVWTARLTEHPEQAVDTLRKLHWEQSPDRFTFAKALADSIETSIQSVDSLCSHRLICTLLEVALSDSLYYLEPTGNATFEQLQTYLCSVFRALYICCGATIQREFRQQCRDESQTSHYLSKFPQLWRILWIQQDIYNSDLPNDTRSMKDNKDSLRQSLAELCACYLHFQDWKTPPISEKVAHVAFTAWLSQDDPIRSQHSLELALSLIIDYDRPQRTSFFNEVIVIPGFTSQVIERLCVDLQTEYTLDSALQSYLGMLRQVISCCPSVRDLDLSAESLDVISCITDSLQRQLCSGGDGGSIQTFAIGLDCICIILNTYLGYSHHRDSRFRTESVGVSDIHVLLPLCANLTLPAVVATGEQLMENIFTILNAFSQCVSAKTLSDPSSNETMAILRTSRHTSTSIINALRTSTKIPVQNQLPRRALLKAWLLFANTVGFTESSVGSPSKPFRKRCHWKDCLCLERRPLHPMRVCKGCWKVFYCGPRCQARDWNEGNHRSRCQ